MQFPVYDFRYRADPNSPFRLYDCMTPALREHTKVPIDVATKCYMKEIKFILSLNEAKDKEIYALKR